jgi:hypothetical protein
MVVFASHGVKRVRVDRQSRARSSTGGSCLPPARSLDDLFATYHNAVRWRWTTMIASGRASCLNLSCCRRRYL